MIRPLSLLFFCLLLSSLPSFGQSRTDLEARRKELNNQLQETKKMLGEARQNRKAALNQLLTLEAQVEQRREVIGVLENEIGWLSSNIERNNGVIDALGRDLAKVREDYARLVRFAYRHRNQLKNWLYVVSAQGVRDAWNRWHNILRIFAYRKRQLEFIRETQASLQGKVMELNKRLRERGERLTEHESHTRELDQDAKEKEQLVKSLKKEEARLSTEAKQIETNRDKLNAAIEDVIRQEMARAKERARKAAEAKKTPNAANKGATEKTAPKAAPETNDEPPLTPAETKLAASFGGSRGKLPWPVERGVVVGKFGTHPHPVLPKVQIRNNGIDISTVAGAPVASVYEGTVLAAFFSPAFQNCVVVQHGNYFTVYSNMSDLKVENGQSVTAKQILGTAFTNEEGVTSIHFEVWKGKSKQNPEGWLKRR